MFDRPEHICLYERGFLSQGCILHLEKFTSDIQDVNYNNHRVVEEAFVHSYALSVETTVLLQVCQEQVKRSSRLLV